MNQANVAALAALMRQYLAELMEFRAKSAYVPNTDEQEAESVAQWLAARGVLVPAALTDDEVYAAWEAGARTVYPTTDEGDEYGVIEYDSPAPVRAALERIAKGEAIG